MRDTQKARDKWSQQSIKKNWEKYKEWRKLNKSKLAKTSDGDYYGPTNYTEFENAWLSMSGSAKLNRIKYQAKYLTSYKTAVTMRKRWKELHPDEEAPSLEDIKKKDVYSFRKKYFDEDLALESAYQNKIYELRREYAAKGLPIDEHAIKQQAKLYISDYFFGS